MIYKLLRLRCDFCTCCVTDEFRNQTEARKLMSEHGWTRVKVKNGSWWDRCPQCTAIHKGESDDE